MEGRTPYVVRPDVVSPRPIAIPRPLSQPGDDAPFSRSPLVRAGNYLAKICSADRFSPVNCRASHARTRGEGNIERGVQRRRLAFLTSSQRERALHRLKRTTQ